MLLGVMLSTFFPAYADEYKSMIRYDRVWECLCVLDKDGETVLKCMKFDGPEEINGKVYHKIVTFKKTFLTFEYGSDTPTYESVDCFEPEGFMREEDGVVYTLVAERQYDTTSEGEPLYYGVLYTSIEEDLDGIICREYEIYNFNVKEEDYYSSVSFIYGFGSEQSAFNVLNVSTIEVAGEECRMMYVCPEFEVEYHKTYETPYYWYYPIIESVGAVDYGCLNYHEFIDHPTKMYAHHYFCRLFDLDGNVIYPLDYEEIPYNIDYGSFNSVDIISSSITPKDPHMYDILGRRIRQPVPGQLYIRDGKKMIAPNN